MKEPKGVYYVIAKLGKKEYKNKLIKLN
jgi:hypothetical protein